MSIFNDSRFTSLEVTDYLKIPTCTDAEIKKNVGREGEIKFNVSNNSLMIRTPSEWKAIPTVSDDPPPPYVDGKKTMKMKIVDDRIVAEFSEIRKSLTFQQIQFLMDESRKLNLNRIDILYKKNISESLKDFLVEINVPFSIDDKGNISIGNTYLNEKPRENGGLFKRYFEKSNN